MDEMCSDIVRKCVFLVSLRPKDIISCPGGCRDPHILSSICDMADLKSSTIRDDEQIRTPPTCTGTQRVDQQLKKS